MIGRRLGKIKDMLKKFLDGLAEPGSITEENLSTKLRAGWADRIKKTIPRKDYKSDSEWLSMVCDEIFETLAHVLVRKKLMEPILGTSNLQRIEGICVDEIFMPQERWRS